MPKPLAKALDVDGVNWADVIWQRWCREMYVDACLASAMLKAGELASVLHDASTVLRADLLAGAYGPF